MIFFNTLYKLHSSPPQLLHSIDSVNRTILNVVLD